MTRDVAIRREGRAGRITLDRPEALNALTWEMCLAIDAALADWANDDAVALVILDGAGERAFCAGGDIAEMHSRGMAGDHDYGRRFWADEYRMNARIAHYPKPVVALLHGFTMGGGVGLGCHASHRVVGDTSRVAMPECAIGLVPDVGGTRLLARAPGRLGAFLGTTGHRMGPGDAIRAGFADNYLPEAPDALVSALCRDGRAEAVEEAAARPPDAPLLAWASEIDRLFAAGDAAGVAAAIAAGDGPAAEAARTAFAAGCPLSIACTLEILARLGPEPSLEQALTQEARFTFRASRDGDFLEGIRAAIIDRDRTPRWRHEAPETVPRADVERMLAPLGPDAPDFHPTRAETE